MRFYLAKILVVVLVFTGYFLFFQITAPHNGGVLVYQAQAQTNGLVPCGRNPNNPDNPPETTRPCTPCDFFQLVSNVFNFFIFYFVPAVATLFFLIAGFLILLGGASPKQIATGKSIFKTTAIGVAVIFGAWMITNTVLKSLAGNSDYSTHWYSIQCTNPVQVAPPSTQLYTCSSENKCVVAPSSATGKTYTTSNCDNACQVTGGVLRITTTTLPDAIVGQSYNNFITVSGGMPPYTFSTTGSLPAGLDLSDDGAINGVPTAEGSATFSVEVTDSSTPQQSVIGDVKITVKAQGAASSIPAGCFDVDANGVINEQDCGAPENDQCSLCNPTATVATQAYTCSNVGQCIEDPDGEYDTLSDCNNECQAASNAAPPVAGVACRFSGVNLCEGVQRPGGCGGSACSAYLPSINNYANGAATTSLLKALMVIESDCNVRAATGSSYGLMQLQPDTANRFRNRCGITENITAAWLTNPANADKSICLGAAFVSSIAAGTCGSEPRNIYAGYNGGSLGAASACAHSRDCAKDTSCSGGTVQRWECLYDNVAHTVCNGGDNINSGYNQTKQGATYMTYCVNNPGF